MFQLGKTGRHSSIGPRETELIVAISCRNRTAAATLGVLTTATRRSSRIRNEPVHHRLDRAISRAHTHTHTHAHTETHTRAFLGSSSGTVIFISNCFLSHLLRLVCVCVCVSSVPVVRLTHTHTHTHWGDGGQGWTSPNTKREDFPHSAAEIAAPPCGAPDRRWPPEFCGIFSI